MDKIEVRIEVTQTTIKFQECLKWRVLFAKLIFISTNLYKSGHRIEYEHAMILI